MLLFPNLAECVAAKMVAAKENLADADEVLWDVDQLVVGDGTRFASLRKISRRRKEHTTQTLKRCVLYGARGLCADLSSFWPISSGSLSLFPRGFDKGASVNYKTAPLTQLASERSESRVGTTVAISPSADSNGRSRGRPEASLKKELLKWLRENPGHKVVIGGPRARAKSGDSDSFRANRPDPEHGTSSTFLVASSLLVEINPDEPGRCVPAAAAIGCVLISGKCGFVISSEAAKSVLKTISSSYVVGSRMVTLDNTVRALHLESTSHIPCPLPSFAMSGVGKSEIDEFLGSHPQTVTTGTTSTTSPDDRGDIYIIRFLSKPVDHAICVDCGDEVIFDPAEGFPMTLCISSLGIASQLGRDVDVSTLSGAIVEFRKNTVGAYSTDVSSLFCYPAR